MGFKRIFKYSVLVIVLGILFYGIRYAWQAVPIMSGYSAKCMCSSVMVAGRDPENVKQIELSFSPISLTNTTVDYSDSSATSTVFGLAKRKAMFRKGLGCALVVEMDEKEFKRIKGKIPPVPVNPDTIDWPTGNRIADTLQAGVDMVKLNAVLDSAFSEPGVHKLRRTRAILVVYDGKLVAERYAAPFNEDSKLLGWSMSKSISNALVGILVKDGKLSLDETGLFEEWKKDDRKDITFNDLMHASSGLEWVEDYGNPSGATNMLFRSKDMGLYASNAKLINKPGEVFYYSSGTTNMISHLIRKRVGDEEYYSFPYDRLFYKIGMYNTILEADAGGTFVGSSYSYAPARDWARFGLLYLNDGVWNGERILPEGWVKYSSTPAKNAPQGEYGAQFWLNHGTPGNPTDRVLPDVPADMFKAVGHEKQAVFIIPSKKLVVVKLSLSAGDYLDDNEFLKGVIDALPK